MLGQEAQAWEHVELDQEVQVSAAQESETSVQVLVPEGAAAAQEQVGVGGRRYHTY